MSLALQYKKQLVSEVGDILIGISHDSMEAYLHLTPLTEMYAFDHGEILTMLKAEGIVHGVEEDRIIALVQNINLTQFPVAHERIARGTPAKAGVDAKIVYHFKLDRELRLVEDEDGNIDYKELGLINNVCKGDLLAEKIPLVLPESGMDIYGNEIKGASAKDTGLVAGNNVRMSEDRMSCYAELDGQVFLKRMMIQVSPIYEVPHDVDLTTGNITFNGSVVVYGSVLSGFAIKAKDNVTIFGVVESANIVAGGNIFIKRGIKGGEKAVIQCKGDLTVKFIESAKVECHGNLLVETSIINADVTCFSKVNLDRGKGQIVGGHVRGIMGIACVEAGSKLGVQTRLTTGDKFIVKERIDETNALLDEKNTERAKVNEFLSKLMEIADNNEVRKEQISQASEQKSSLDKEIMELESKRDKLSMLYSTDTMSRIRVSSICHANVQVTVGHSNMTVQNEYRAPSFYEDHKNKKVKIGSAL